MVANLQTLSIPLRKASIDFTCEFEADLSVLFMGGDMHEYGKSFSVDWNKSNADVERVYDIPEWDVWMRDAPPYEEYGVGVFDVTAGESFTTTCNWHNTGDSSVNFPSEMCATFGMAYPAEYPMICVVEPD